MDLTTTGRRCLPFGSLDRRTILGASEIAPVLGMSRFWSPLAIYLAKHRTDAQMIDRNAATGPARWGQRLEHAIRTAYLEDILGGTDYVILQGDTQVGTVLHPEHEWMAASPDGVVVLADNLDEWCWGLECKNVDRSQAHRWGDVGTDEVPDEYALQCQWAMHVTGLARWDVAALIGGNEFRHYTLHRDEALIAMLVEQMTAFWVDHVQAGVPPDPMAQDNDVLSRILPFRSPEVVDNDPAINALAVAVRDARAAAEPYADAVNLAEAQLKVAIGDRAGAVGPWGKLSFRPNKPTISTDWKALASEMGYDAELIAKYTTEKAGARPFRLTFQGE